MVRFVANVVSVNAWECSCNPINNISLSFYFSTFANYEGALLYYIEQTLVWQWVLSLRLKIQLRNFCHWLKHKELNKKVLRFPEEKNASESNHHWLSNVDISGFWVFFVHKALVGDHLFFCPARLACSWSPCWAACSHPSATGKTLLAALAAMNRYNAFFLTNNSLASQHALGSFLHNSICN